MDNFKALTHVLENFIAVDIIISTKTSMIENILIEILDVNS